MEKYMKVALKEAEKAAQKGEVPVGAVIVINGEIISKAHNEIESKNDPTNHAEILAIKKACKKRGYSRLEGATIYVTLEPCSMCAGAIVLARIENLVIGARDNKSGACGSVLQIANNSSLNHRVNITNSIMEEDCSKILKEFFVNLRKEKRGV